MDAPCEPPENFCNSPVVEVPRHCESREAGRSNLFFGFGKALNRPRSFERNRSVNGGASLRANEVSEAIPTEIASSLPSVAPRDDKFPR
jgi:hypothetical protein